MFGWRRRLGARRRRRMGPRLARLFGGPRPSRGDRSGVDEPARWRSRRSVRIATLVTGLAALLFILWLGWVAYLYIVRNGPSSATFDPDKRCAALGFSCGIATNILASGVLVAFASTFVLWRLFGLQRRYRVRAREDSRELVPTAGAIIDQVVGRDELCMAVMTDLHDRGSRPHVIVGGVGTGKTAVLVRLTEYLAEKRAIPVPIKLRDATTELDFEAMARTRFLSEVNPGLISSAEGETIWRRLRKDGKIIVLADGLEEAIVGTPAEPERDNIIREAIRRAHQHRLPLVIASRPHDPLRATDAAILNLEPLSFEAALAYIGSDGTSEDERRLAWIVETADVVEAPLYLQITRELHVKGLLEPTSAGQQGVVDTRGVDRSRLRLSLLETWERALISGHLREEIPLNHAERQAALEHMSALACAGLRYDRLEVEFETELGPLIQAEVEKRLDAIDEQTGQAPGVRNIDVRLAAAWAAQLNLVEVRGHSIRFPHSLMQAYLGSRLLDAALRDADYLRDALQYPRPGREFVIALVLRSRAADLTGRAGADRTADRSGRTRTRRGDPSASEAATSGARLRRLAREGATERGSGQPDFLASLRASAATRDDNKVLDMYAAALEIDCVSDAPDHENIAAEIRGRWSRIHAQDPRTLEEGKLALVHRFGEAARMIDDRQRGDEPVRARPAYPQLYAIGGSDSSYPVQLAAAQEIGVGGETAYEEMRDIVTAPCQHCQAERAERPEHPVGEAASVAPAYRHAPGHERITAESSRAGIISAWLAPMLVGSVGARSTLPADRIVAEHARDDLGQWLRHIAQDGRLNGEQDLPIALEIALAQGFKYAANRRPGQPDLLRESRMFLAEQALEMLKSARYWFSQLTLIHALTLLNLSESKQPWDKYGARPEAIVQHWLDVAGRERSDRADRADRNLAHGARFVPHPFVSEAALLCVLALKTERPQRYIWIDESGVVGQVGSRNLSKMEQQRRHRLWIPPSAGWSALNGRAQQLVADVLLLRNLAERGDLPHDRERRLRRSNRGDLPPCITHYREALEPALTVGTAVSIVPGVSCVDGCVFELCPYPPKGVQPRVEMSEAFCRRQLTLLDRSLRHPLTRQAPWQQMAASHLSRFWMEMADRARGARPQPVRSRRGRSQ
jgi:hypothetical protein